MGVGMLATWSVGYQIHGGDADYVGSVDAGYIGVWMLATWEWMLATWGWTLATWVWTLATWSGCWLHGSGCWLHGVDAGYRGGGRWLHESVDARYMGVDAGYMGVWMMATLVGGCGLHGGLVLAIC